MITAAIIIASIVIGASIFFLTRQKNVYVKYDPKIVEDIESKFRNTAATIQNDNQEIRTKKDALKELNRYHNGR